MAKTCLGSASLTPPATTRFPKRPANEPGLAPHEASIFSVAVSDPAPPFPMSIITVASMSRPGGSVTGADGGLGVVGLEAAVCSVGLVRTLGAVGRTAVGLLFVVDLIHSIV